MGVTIGLVVGAASGRRARACAPGRKDAAGGHGRPGRGGLHAVFHPPPRAGGGGPSDRRHRARDRWVQTFLACTFHAPEVLAAPALRGPAAAGVPVAPDRLVWPCVVHRHGPPPSSSGLGHRPFTAAAPVRIRLGVLYDLKLPGTYGSHCSPERSARIRTYNATLRHPIMLSA